jgi:hypothetical protein
MRMEFEEIILMESLELETFEESYSRHYSVEQMEEKLRRFREQERMIRHSNPSRAKLLQISIKKLEDNLRKARSAA